MAQSRHADPALAAIAATTSDINAVAAALTAQADVAGWARAIGADLLPPPPPPRGDDGGEPPAVPAGPPMPPMDVLRRIPADPARYQRWRQLWAELATDPRHRPEEHRRTPQRLLRQAQRIRAIGPTGLLNSPIPPAVRLAHLATSNGHLPHPPMPTT